MCMLHAPVTVHDLQCYRAMSRSSGSRGQQNSNSLQSYSSSQLRPQTAKVQGSDGLAESTNGISEGVNDAVPCRISRYLSFHDFDSLLGEASGSRKSSKSGGSSGTARALRPNELLTSFHHRCESFSLTPYPYPSVLSACRSIRPSVLFCFFPLSFLYTKHRHSNKGPNNVLGYRQ